MTDKRPTVVTIGLHVLDVVCDGASSAWAAAGGSAANVAVRLARAGWDAYPMARFDDGEAARMVVDDLERTGVRTEWCRLPMQKPAPLIIQFPGPTPGSHRFSSRCPRCTGRVMDVRATTREVVEAALASIGDPTVLYFDREWPSAISAARRVREADGLVYFEPTKIPTPDRTQRAWRDALSLAHVVKYSADAWRDWPAPTTLDTTALLEIETLGADGLRYRRSGSSDWTVVPSVAFVEPSATTDTSGAGDALSAALIDRMGRLGHQWLGAADDAELEAIFTDAMARAAEVCRFVGARGDMCPESDTHELDSLLDRICPHCVRLHDVAATRRAAEAASPPVETPAVLVLGGSFNPIHDGHIAVARFALDALGFARIVFVPNGDNYGKAGLAPAALRLKMVEAALAGEDRFEVDPVEVKSRTRMRTVTTMLELRERFADAALWLYRGLDSLPRTHRKLFEIPGLRVLVLDRPGADKTFEATIEASYRLTVNRAWVKYVAGPLVDLSSTDVREAVAAGRSLDGMVPAAVAHIIDAEGLYRD